MVVRYAERAAFVIMKEGADFPTGPEGDERLMPMDFNNDLRDEIMKHLPYDKTDAALSAEIAALPTTDLVCRFFNWLSRFIHPHPRVVLKSQAYVFRRVPPKEQVYLEHLGEKIEAGKDIAPHLSRGVIHGFVNGTPVTAKKNLGRRRDLDLLLNDWGIHHLHLPDALDSDGFVRRDPVLDRDLLLFAMFQDHRAYFLDVLPHGEWTNESLVEIAVRNWPSARLFIRLNVVAISETTTAAERQRLRAAGVNVPMQIDGGVYMAGMGGLTTAGTGTHTMMRAQRLLRSLFEIARKMGDDPNHLRPLVERQGYAYPQNPDFHVIFGSAPASWEFVIKEEVTGAMIWIRA